MVQVTAHDRDTGNNARLTYTIKEKEYENVFGVFPNSGSLYLKEVSLVLGVVLILSAHFFSSWKHPMTCTDQKIGKGCNIGSNLSGHSLYLLVKVLSLTAT